MISHKSKPSYGTICRILIAAVYAIAFVPLWLMVTVDFVAKAYRANRFTKEGVTTVGKIIGTRREVAGRWVSPGRKYGGGRLYGDVRYSYYTKYAFYDENGKEHFFERRDNSAHIPSLDQDEYFIHDSSGQQVDIIYVKSDPSIAELDEDIAKPPRGTNWLLLGGFTVVGFGGPVLFYRYSKTIAERLWRTWTLIRFHWQNFYEAARK